MEKLVIPPSRPIAGLSVEEMYARVLEGDPSSNGRFFFGVITTGIYCLPSCSARKPLRANIRFFRATEEARSAGLRPCRKCHPDDFARGLDPEAEELQDLVDEVCADPSRYPDVATLVRRSGYGATRLFEMFRRRFGLTPASFLRRVRIETAKRLLRESDETITGIAFASGFQSASAFHHLFKQATGLTPAQFRARHKEES